MFLLSAAAEWIFWPLYVNIPANMGVSLQHYCSNWLKSTKRFTEPPFGNFLQQNWSNLFGSKNPQRGCGSSHSSLTLKRRHIKQTSHNRSTVVCEPWSAAIKGCFFCYYRCCQGDRREAVTARLAPCPSWLDCEPLSVTEPAKKLCVKYFVATNEQRSSPAWSHSLLPSG